MPLVILDSQAIHKPWKLVHSQCLSPLVSVHSVSHHVFLALQTLLGLGTLSPQEDWEQLPQGRVHSFAFMELITEELN